ncbi:Rv2175c family DNA-binding protein [Segeticoccus rhizosphaerae]|uniref:Rv2175c family DNA-binding protein n=1 Tax=Segeticoccus rhizosphaerae TaxID=1104777 RepID=UPI0030829D15
MNSFDAASTAPGPIEQDRTDSTGPTQVPPPTGVEAQVGNWLTVPDIADRMGVRLSEVRRMIEDRELLAARIGPRSVVAVPAKFVTGEGPLPTLRGTFTVLADGGMDDEQIIGWLFTPDETLSVEGAPIDALLAGRKKEVRRRAQELAF